MAEATNAPSAVRRAAGSPPHAKTITLVKSRFSAQSALNRHICAIQIVQCQKNRTIVRNVVDIALSSSDSTSNSHAKYLFCLLKEICCNHGDKSLLRNRKCVDRRSIRRV